MRKIILLSLAAAVFAFSSCSSQKVDSDDDFSVEAGSGDASGDDLALDGADDSKKSDDLSLEEGSSDKSAEGDSAADKGAAAQDSDLALENELNSLDSTTSNAQTPPPKEEELSLEEPAAQNVAKADTPPPQETPPPEMAPPVVAEPPVEVPPVAETPPPAAETPPSATPTGEPATISNVQYKGNSNGGTIAITADKPLTFTTRMNSTTNQFVVEVQNSTIPKKLKRSLNTKDMASSIGSVDIYQKDGSNVSRFVVQLRPGSTDPIIQQEGNSLLVIGAAVAQNGAAEVPAQAQVPTPAAATPVETAPPAVVETEPVQPQAPAAAPSAPEAPQVAEMPEEAPAEMVQATEPTAPTARGGILSYETLDQFLMNNTRYYGKKVNFETYGMDTAEALKFLAEEGGINLILDDPVFTMGKVNIKLRDVPWDQAFVLILKSKKLVYKRQGNVIRVATLADIKKDEEDAIAMKEARKKPEPLAVKRFFISYVDLGDVKTKISEYLQILTQQDKDKKESNPNAGKVIEDKRNNSIIVTDTEANLKRIEEIITALDTQPKQVQIEAKVIEANETYTRNLGVDWSITQPSTTTPSLTPTTYRIDGGGKGFTTDFRWGKIDVLGALNASLALSESENRVKVLSSPRITVLSGVGATIASTVDVSVPKTIISNGVATTTSESKPVGVNLAVTPIANNGGTVKLTLSISRSASSGSGGNVATSNRSASTELFVRSGTTAVIGGIYNTSVSEDESGIPGLRSIPVLGNAFKSSNTGRAKSELLMFVTPTILRPL